MKQRAYGWLDLNVYISSHEREFMLESLTEAELQRFGALDPKIEESREVLAEGLYARISRAHEAEDRESLRLALNILGAAVVELAKSEDFPVMSVPGVQFDRPSGGLVYLYMCSGTSGERILLDAPYPRLCYPSDPVGADLRRAFRTFFGPRVIPREPSISRYRDDPMLYVVLDVPWAMQTQCPCGTNKRYDECHGAREP